MLSRADCELVARDPDLPGLALVLDPSALLGQLRARWPELALTSLEPSYLRYKPGVSCLAGFAVDVNGAQTWLTFTARRRNATDKLQKVLQKPGVPGLFGSGRGLIRELALTMASFPNDPAIKRLRQVDDAMARQALLTMLGLPREAEIVPLRYRPGRRFVGRVDYEGAPLAQLKLHAPAAFAKSLASAQAFGSNGPLLVPALIGSSQRHGAVASAWLPGAPATPDASTARRIGAALAALHRQPAAGLAPLTRKDQQRGAWAIARDVAALIPSLAEFASDLAEQIAAAVESDAPQVSLHGDCHLEQVLDHDASIALVDFDEAARGPAGWDLGNLLAHLAVDGNARVHFANFQAALVDGYRAAGGLVSEHDLAAQTALALLRLATRPFRERRPNWPETIAAILARAETACPSMAITPLLPIAQRDADLPQLAEALDPGIAQTAFAAAGLPVRIDIARLVRHKPGRRCLIAYDLLDRSGGRLAAYGKLRAKGADSRAFALQQELWRDGFGPGGWAGARVAQPLALVPALGLWVQAAVPGEPFATDTCSPERAAKAIAALHRARIRPMRRYLLADELAILEGRLGALAAHRPDWADRLDRLFVAARQCAQRALPVALRPIHRDFYHDHLICAGEDSYLIDLDLLCLGDPAVDIGNFNAHLSELGLREHHDPRRYAWWQARFAAAACRGPLPVRADNVRIYEFLSLLRLVEIAERMPERRGGAEALLALCETLALGAPALSRR